MCNIALLYIVFFIIYIYIYLYIHLHTITYVYITYTYHIQELASFCSTQPGTFPKPQHANCFATTIGGGTKKGAGFIILGDAAHAFPPDLGTPL